MKIQTLIGFATACLWGSQASAHAFESGANLYAQFQEGTSVILSYPETLLPLMTLGILLSLWTIEGLIRAWPAFLIGLVTGFPFAALIGPWIVPVILAAGILTAALGAILNSHTKPAALGLSLVMGLLVSMVSLEGHGFLELPFFIYAGIFFGANLVLAISAGLTRFALEKVEAPWMRILCRVAASWIGAILMLVLAFTLRGA